MAAPTGATNGHGQTFVLGGVPNQRAAGIHVGDGLLARTAFSRCSTAIFLR